MNGSLSLSLAGALGRAPAQAEAAPAPGQHWTLPRLRHRQVPAQGHLGVTGCCYLLSKPVGLTRWCLLFCFGLVFLCDVYGFTFYFCFTY